MLYYSMMMISSIGDNYCININCETDDKFNGEINTISCTIIP